MKLKKLTSVLLAAAVTVASLPAVSAQEYLSVGDALGNGKTVITADSGTEAILSPEKNAEKHGLPEGMKKGASKAAVVGEINAVTSSDSNYEYTTNKDGEATITKYLGTDTRVVIPDRIDGHKVTAIGECAFKDNKDLETVELSSGITTIYSDSWGDGAFAGCTSLATVKFNDALTTIEKNTFKGCEMLKEAKFGANLAYIGNSAFEGCKELAILEFTDTDDTKATALEIGEYAFKGCERLTKVIFPNSLSAIYAAAFENCTRLEEVELNGSITTIYSGTWGYGAFAGCTSLATVKFNDDLTRIEKNTFKGCEMLKEAKFGANLTYIGNSAFESCTSMDTLTIPASVSIEKNAFTNSALKTVCCPNNSNSAIWAIDNNYTVVLSDNDRVPPKHSRLDYDGSSFVMNSSGGYSATCTYKFTELMPGEMKIKIPAYAELKSITVNGAQGVEGTSYTVKDEHIFIPINDTEGKISLSFTQNNILQMPTYATVTYDNGSVTDIIGIINETSVCNSESGIVVTNPNVGGLTLEVTETSSEESAINYNIELKDQNGKTVQLNGEALVRIPVPNGWLEDVSKITVLRKEADGSLTDMKAVYENGYMVFTTDHFSEYVMSQKPAVALGEINGDGKLSAVDAKWVLQAVSGSRVLD